MTARPDPLPRGVLEAEAKCRHCRGTGVVFVGPVAAEGVITGSDQDRVAICPRCLGSCRDDDCHSLPVVGAVDAANAVVQAIANARGECADRLQEVVDALGNTHPIPAAILRDVIAEWRRETPVPRQRTARGNWRFR